MQDVASSSEIDYMDGVTASFYNDDIMVFTPQGRGIILPKGAIALDFAFEIHSKVGLHALYARINGKLSSVKLFYIVEIVWKLELRTMLLLMRTGLITC